MNNQDKFLEQFRHAARQSEQERFPGFEEVWQQVEERLDAQEKKRAPSVVAIRWMSVAAAVLVMVAIGMLLWKKDAPATEMVKQQQPDSTMVTPLVPQQEIARLEESPRKKTAPVIVEQKQASVPQPNQATADTSTFESSPELVTALKPVADNSAQPTPVKSSKDLASGIITDANGKPLPGSTIIIKGSNRGVATDSAGRFSIEANEGDKLSVAMLGFDPKEVIVSPGRELKVALDQATSSLSEVVVVGYAATKKKSLTASVQQVRGSNVRSKSANAAAPLQGKAVGVYINAETSGVDYAIRIRGINSMQSANDPLYVVNGVPVGRSEFSKLQPAEIERVDVLKDAAASAIYGSKASNGVVIISTKDKTRKEQQQVQKFN
ncbi:MAG TPA: TonB-dependent receptor plug domain-containing protein, partial [Phnomibacter sp.]|nr:TonB-dependent receptor plug domain-containing protein [Phnomibacter sp.]